MGEDRLRRARRADSCGAAHRVLLIEDHEPLARATAELMLIRGLEVRIASTGKDALAIAAAFQPEIVLCDMRLPDMRGLDVVRALRQTPGAKDALIAMHTAMSESDVRALERDENAPVNALLCKPLTDEKLNALLSELELMQRSAAPAPARDRPEKTGKLELGK